MVMLDGGTRIIPYSTCGFFIMIICKPRGFSR